MSDEMFMILPSLLRERAGRKYFDVRKGPLLNSLVSFLEVRILVLWRKEGKLGACKELLQP